MKTKPCPTCGQPIVADIASAKLTKSERRLYEIVKAAGAPGITSRDIMKKLYAEDPSGGPENPNIVSVFASNANAKLAAHHLKLTARRGPWPLWRLVYEP